MHPRLTTPGFLLSFLTLLALLAAAPQAFADGGVVIGERDGAGLRITVFAEPVPIRAGPADFSVLVQEVDSRQPVMDADVRISLKKVSAPSPEKEWSPPYCQVPGNDGYVVLRHDLAQNKMLYAAMVAVTEAGRWELSISVVAGDRRFAASLPLDVGAPRRPLATWWPAIALLPVGIFLYAWRAILVRARRRAAGS